MKKNVLFYFRIVILSSFSICSSCVEEDHKSNNPSSEIGTSTRSASYQNIKGTISGEMAPYIGEHYYTYTVSLSAKLNGAASVKLTSNGSAALFRDHTGNFRNSSGSLLVPQGSTKFTFDVYWIKNTNNTCLFITSDFNSVRQIEGTLCDIKVQTNSISINGSKDIVQGDELELSASYDKINNNHRAVWKYDSSHFSLIKAWNDNSKYYAKFKAIKEISNSQFELLKIGLNIEEVFLVSNWLCVKQGETSIKVKDPFYYEFNRSTVCTENVFSIELPNISSDSDAEINWITEGPIELILGQGSNKASFSGVSDKNGYASITTNISYKGLYKTKKTDKFWVGMPLLSPYQGKQIEDKGQGVSIPLKAAGYNSLECELLSGEALVSIKNQSLNIKPTNSKASNKVSARVRAYNSCGTTTMDYNIEVLKAADYVGIICNIDGSTLSLNVNPKPVDYTEAFDIRNPPGVSSEIIGPKIVFTFHYNFWISNGKPPIYYRQITNLKNEQKTIRIHVSEECLIVDPNEPLLTDPL